MFVNINTPPPNIISSSIFLLHSPIQFVHSNNFQFVLHFPQLIPPQMVELIANTKFSIQFVLDKINAHEEEAKSRKGSSSSSSDDSDENREFDVPIANQLQGFEATNISEGSAFLSVILRLNLHWKKAGDLPNSIIMKVPGPQRIGMAGDHEVYGDVDESEVQKEMTRFLAIAHSREVRFYQHFPPLDAGLRLPKFYFGSDYNPSKGEGLILMEDLTPRGVTIPTLPGFNHAQLLDLIGEVARVHAASWRFPDWVDKIGSDEIHPGFIGGMRENAIKLKELDPPSLGPLVDRLLPLFTSEFCALSNYREAKFGFPPSIVHADLWAANVLWEKDAQGRATDKLAAIIDWQCVHSGNPCEDLVRILSLNTSGKYRRENEAKLLEFYAEKVAEFMGGKAPFTIEQLREAYRQTLPYCMMYFCFGAPFYYGMDSVVGMEPIEREKNQREFLDRCKMFLEDTAKEYCR